MDLGLSDRVAVVTAASRGLGRAAVEALAQEGCNIVMCARQPGPLEEEAERVRALGVDVVPLVLDVASPTAPLQIMESALKEFGRLDVLVGNIGGPPSGDPLTFRSDEVVSAVSNGILSQVHLVRAAVPLMRSSGWGRICLIASTGVREPLPGHSLSAFRSGLWSWAKSISHELAGDGITINMACAGLHRTDRMSEPGFSVGAVERDSARKALVGDPRDFGGLVAFLCSERARWINGVALNVDGGNTLALL
jgi:3-oxoacyl-[acyl-carrier protein] reductase